jgi:MYXO-CTERM domain-containing protein
LFVADDAIPEVPGGASSSSSSTSGGWGDEGGGGADPGTGAVSSGGICSVHAPGEGNDRAFVGALLLTGLVVTARRRRGAAARGS